MRFEVRLAALGQIQIAECIAVPIAVREQRGEQRRAMARVARVLRGEQHAAVDEQMTVAVAGRIDEQLRPDLEERDALRRGRAADRGHGRGQLPVGGQRGLRDAPIAALGAAPAWVAAAVGVSVEVSIAMPTVVSAAAEGSAVSRVGSPPAASAGPAARAGSPACANHAQAASRSACSSSR
ncbi:hypothetical protein BMMON2_02170 [Burkholderia mallei]